MYVSSPYDHNCWPTDALQHIFEKEEREQSEIKEDSPFLRSCVARMTGRWLTPEYQRVARVAEYQMEHIAGKVKAFFTLTIDTK